MTPWLILGAVLAAAGAAAGGYYYGGKHERHAIEAQAGREERIARMAIDAANGVTGRAIARIRVNNTTVMGEVRREVQTNTVYAECLHSADQLRRINAALVGDGPGPKGADRSGMPASSSAR